MEFLSLSFELEHVGGNISPIYKCEPILNHLIYADDLLICAKASLNNAVTVKWVLSTLKDKSGLVINEQESKPFAAKVYMENRKSQRP